MNHPSRTVLHRVLFLINWGASAFTIGVCVLFFLLRRWIDNSDLQPFTQRVLVWVVMLLVLATGFFVARRLQPLVFMPALARRLPAMLVPSLVALVALVWVLSPKNVYGRSQEAVMGDRFIIGPYPTTEKLDSLQDAGFTGVVSLLSDAVVPFEPVLLRQERELVSDAGLQLIEAPMLPWISDNKAAHQIVDSLVNKTKGRYYVHCYLGRDRTGLVRRWLEQLLQRPVTAQSAARRRLEEVRQFERGEIYKLRPETYLVPFPTDEELTGFIANGRFSVVVNLLDTVAAESRDRLARQNKMLTHAGIQIITLPMPENATAKSYRAAVDSVVAMNQSVVVIGWRTTKGEGRLFLDTWNQYAPQKATRL